MNNSNYGNNNNGRGGRRGLPEKTGKISEDDDSVENWKPDERDYHTSRFLVDKLIGINRTDSEFFRTLNNVSQKI